jgi:S-adenosylmethionine:tRNA ribosyltransferase-isomerase
VDYITADFDFGIPQSMVAQEPVTPRDSSRLMVIRRDSQIITHERFFEVPSYLRSGDALVFNDSRVIPARLKGNKAEMEPITVLLLRKVGDKSWEAYVEQGSAKKSDTINFTGFSGKVLEVGERIGKKEETLITLEIADDSKIDSAGEAPVPPYIHGYKGDPERYQTVYSRIRGSAAAPTAGLHFTDRLLEELRQKGVILCFVTLHVGIDTFMPVMEETPKEHKMYTEFCMLSKETADKLNTVKSSGRKIYGVGTTSVRTMESAHNGKEFKPYSDWTSIYILPGYKFKSIDGMITNFHYPKSTNLMMICALAGYSFAKKAYLEAVQTGYRFYSFGDSMLIL